MTYISGGIVQASDYNTLVDQIKDVFGLGTGDSGYGGNSINTRVVDPPMVDYLPIIGPGDIIQSATDTLDDAFPPGSPDEWVNLRNAFADCATHQNTVLSDILPSVSLLEDGDIVTFYNTLNSVTNSTALNTNRNNVNIAHLSLSTLGTSVRSTSWTSFVQHDFTVDFGTEDNARYFFNTGGEIRISASRSGGSATPQNTAWTTLLSNSGTFIFDQTSYFALTDIFVFSPPVGETFPDTGGGAYDAVNVWAIGSRRESFLGVRGGNGSVIRFRSNFTDGHLTGFEDLVDGTLTSTIQQFKSVAIFPISSPTFATITALTVGS